MAAESDDYEFEDGPVPSMYVIGDNQLILTEQSTAAKSLKSVAKAVEEVCATSLQPFSLSRRADGHHRVIPNREGVKLVTAVTHQLPLIEELLPDNAFNPYVEVLRWVLKEMPDIGNIPRKLNCLVGQDAQLVHERLEELVRQLQWHVHGEDFQRELDNRRRQMRKNHRKGIKYIDGCFERYYKLLVIRVDLACGSEPWERRGIVQTVDLKQARKEFARFLCYLRNNFPLVGYMYLLEYGLFTGYHFHVLVLLNGHKVYKDESIAAALGEHWKHAITEGRGRYWNCNAKKSDYIGCALGMIKRTDTYKRSLLTGKVMDYLTRKKFWMRVVGAVKTFATGEMP